MFVKLEPNMVAVNLSYKLYNVFHVEKKMKKECVTNKLSLIITNLTCRKISWVIWPKKYDI